MSLSIKEKELVAIGISVVAGCKPCTDYHVRAGCESGATDDEIRLAIKDAMCVRESARKIMKAHGLQCLGDASNDADCGCGGTNRIKELVSVGAAHAVNCTTNLKKHLAAAKTIDIAETELKEIITLSRFIKGKAASHVDNMVGADEVVTKPNTTLATVTAGSCC